MLMAVSSLKRFQGALVGAVLGDCLGARYEGQERVNMSEVCEYLDSQPIQGSERKPLRFTDDTAMARSVAKSLIEKKDVDAHDMAQRFADEYFREHWRGYGGSVVDVFCKLQERRYTDVFQPAKEQFEGQGSFGNGGAMRISPMALFGFNYSEGTLIEKVREVTSITHSNQDAINGAVLECLAVHLALNQSSVENFNPSTYLKSLTEIMRRVEWPAKRDSQKTAIYVEKLNMIDSLLLRKEKEKLTCDRVSHLLGNDVSAVGSVPAALYSFLRSTMPNSKRRKDKPQYNGFQRTIIYAISLGGDTDTIATMAGAIAGAFYGIDAIPSWWMTACEGVNDAISYANKLHSLASVRPQRSGQHPDGSGPHSGGETEESHKNTADSIRPNDQYQTAASSYQETPGEGRRHDRSETGYNDNKSHLKPDYE